MNKLIIIGNLTSDPETRIVNVQNGQATACNFTVAVNRVVRNNKTTEYFRVSCWNRQAENAAKYLAKGSKVSVSGPVSARAYTGRDGSAHASIEVSAEEIEYLNSRSQQEGHEHDAQGNQGAPVASPDDFVNIPEGIENEIPFN